MSMGPNEKGTESSFPHEEYLSPPSKGAEVGHERLNDEENPSGQQACWQGGRFPSLYGHKAPHGRRVSGENERLWSADGDLGTQRTSIRRA